MQEKHYWTWISELLTELHVVERCPLKLETLCIWEKSAHFLINTVIAKIIWTSTERQELVWRERLTKFSDGGHQIVIWPTDEYHVQIPPGKLNKTTQPHPLHHLINAGAASYYNTAITDHLDNRHNNWNNFIIKNNNQGSDSLLKLRSVSQYNICILCTMTFIEITSGETKWLLGY